MRDSGIVCSQRSGALRSSTRLRTNTSTHCKYYSCSIIDLYYLSTVIVAIVVFYPTNRGFHILALESLIETSRETKPREATPLQVSASVCRVLCIRYFHTKQSFLVTSRHPGQHDAQIETFEFNASGRSMWCFR